MQVIAGFVQAICQAIACPQNKVLDLRLRVNEGTARWKDISEHLLTDRRPGGEAVLEAAHGRHRQPHAKHSRDFAGPGAGGVDEGIGRNALCAREHD
jgi:hypothetical protein